MLEGSLTNCPSKCNRQQFSQRDPLHTPSSHAGRPPCNRTTELSACFAAFTPTVITEQEVWKFTHTHVPLCNARLVLDCSAFQSRCILKPMS